MSRAFVEAGSLLGQLDHESAAFGLATTAGVVSHTGAAGLTLGGGFGRLGRRFGLACDNALAFDIVTADGHFLRATEEQNADLLWGLRGGGGNFGVVTAIEYRVHRMDPVILGGYLMWPIEKARDVMRFHRDALASWPEELWVELALVWEKGVPMVGFEVCWSGERTAGEDILKSLRAIAKPAYDDVAPVRYVDMQAYLDESLANGKYYYMKNGFLNQLSDDGIDRILDVFQRDPGLFLLFLDPADGAYHRVAVNATAFPNRSATYWLGLEAKFPQREGAEAKIEKIRAAWKELDPLDTGLLRESCRCRRAAFCVPGKLRTEPGAADRAQGQVRPDQPVPPERQRATEGLTASVGPGPLLELAARGCARGRVDLRSAFRDRGFERRALRERGGTLDLPARLVEAASLEQ